MYTLKSVHLILCELYLSKSTSWNTSADLKKNKQPNEV